MGAVSAVPYSRVIKWRNPSGLNSRGSHRTAAPLPGLPGTSREQWKAAAGQGGCRPTEGTATCHQPTEGTATCRRPTEGSRSRRDRRFGLGAQRCPLPPAPGAAGFVLLNRRSQRTLSKTEMRVLTQPPGPRRFKK